MITKRDAIAAGSAICKAAKRASEDTQSSEDYLRHAARGACIYALDNLWYDVLTNKVRAQFNYNRDAFYTACGWPD